ncbi:AAA family ATPase [Streptomyces sp. OfavH-34-F]|uniref:AAA family ATPase n=1 Tax=Streptomyces sp. OfavH-34-F TaxID=2917760 RepID=UPI001EF3D421|nr:AAA family ATPase [Streptomyces sp. OfavH-34-F]MCG7524202.1 AAA family ATPase [Streptomyces sp. OfavH-34-F]
MTSTARYTTQDILDAEAYVRGQALTRHGEGATALTADQAAPAVDLFEVAVGFELSEEQRAAVNRLLTGGHGVDTVVGVAGASKRTLMEACRIGWDATGTTYSGACLSAVGAQQLAQASGIPARTVASWVQQIRRAAGALGTERTYALPGGERLTLSEGDAVRVRANDYRSKSEQGPDLLNGYRAVVSEITEDGRVEVTWRTRERGQDDSYVSAWLMPAQIAGGALSLGYAMTIAASQGMTCDTSLMYGHGANAFAAYPGLTRGKKENHLWLPLAVIESEETRARLVRRGNAWGAPSTPMRTSSGRPGRTARSPTCSTSLRRLW